MRVCKCRGVGGWVGGCVMEREGDKLKEGAEGERWEEMTAWGQARTENGQMMVKKWSNNGIMVKQSSTV